MLKPDLVIELDYKTVKKEVWGKFTKIYGYCPAIIREKPYIYSNPVDEISQNQAMLRRMRSKSPNQFEREKRQNEDNLEELKTNLGRNKTEKIVKSKSKHRN